MHDHGDHETRSHEEISESGPLDYFDILGTALEELLTASGSCFGPGRSGIRSTSLSREHPRSVRK